MGRVVSRDDVQVIPNGVDLSLFRPLDRRECRRRLRLKNEATYVLFPSDPSRIRKNFACVSEAINRLNAAGDQAFEDLCVYESDQKDIPVYMSACDLLVLVSMWEGSPT